MTFFIGFSIGLFAVAFWLFFRTWCLYADSASYLMISGGTFTSGPFRWRILIPMALAYWMRKNGRPPHLPESTNEVLAWANKKAMVGWAISSWLFLATATGCIALICDRYGVSPIVGSVLFATLPWFRFLSFGAFMTDQIAMACALLCVVLPLEYAIPVAIIGGLAHERSPFFAFLFTLNPWFLVGCIAPVCIALWGPRGRVQPYEWGWVNRPFTAYIYHRQKNIYDYFIPWGVTLLGLTFEWHQLLILAVSYGQLIIGRDRSRLYQWAAPALIAPAVMVLSQLPEPIMYAVLIVNAVMPYMDPMRGSSSSRKDTEYIKAAKKAMVEGKI